VKWYMETDDQEECPTEGPGKELGDKGNARQPSQKQMFARFTRRLMNATALIPVQGRSSRQLGQSHTDEGEAASEEDRAENTNREGETMTLEEIAANSTSPSRAST